MAAGIDGLVESLGNPGKLQVWLGLGMSASLIFVCMHHFSMVFIGAVPPHHCKISNDFPLNVSIPTIWKDGKPMLDECHVFVDPTNHSLGQKECTNGWTYLYKPGEWTVVGQFNLVCKSRYLINTASTIYFCGTIVGSFVFGDLADRTGRKPVFLTNLYTQAVVGIAQYFTESYVMFAMFQFFQGMLIQGLNMSVLCLIMELCHSSWRTESLFIGFQMITIGEFLLVGLAYILPSWKNLYLACTLPSLAGFVYIWLVPESLRWLLVKKHRTEALSVMRRFAQFNNIDLKENLEKEIDCVISQIEAKDSEKKYDICDLFRTKYMRRTTFFMAYLWFSSSFVFFGISFALPSMPFDKYDSFAISIGVEFVCRTLSYQALKVCGRRLVCCMSLLMTAACIAVSAILALFFQSDITNLIGMCLATVARGVCSISGVPMTLLNLECYPTGLRSNAAGFGSLCGRIGCMISPLNLILGDYIHPTIPFCVLAVMSVTAMVASHLMPETFNVSLPDTIEQAEQLNSKSKLKPIYTNHHL